MQGHATRSAEIASTVNGAATSPIFTLVTLKNPVPTTNTEAPGLAAPGAKAITRGNTMKLVADNLQVVIVPDCGHWVAEETPDKLLAALTEFLAPYRSAAS